MFRFVLILIYRAVSRRFRKLAIAFFGVAIAIAALVFLEAIMEGVGDGMVNNTVAIHHGHIACSWQGPSVDAAIVKATSPAISDVLRRKPFSGILQRADRETSLAIYGVEPDAEARRTIISKKIVAGKYLSHPGDIIVGSGAARTLDLAIGDDVGLTAPSEPSTRFTVVGIYRTGLELLDERTAFVTYDKAPGNSNELAIFTKRGADATAVAEAVKRELPTLRVTSWKEGMGELVQLVSLNHVAMNVVILLALVILAFGISNTVYISVMERIREFGILRSMGMTPIRIKLIVVTEVLLLIGLAGGLGIGLGCAVSHTFGSVGLDLGRWTSENPHFLASGVIYPRLTLRAILLPGLVALFCALVAAWLPARKAGKIAIVDALRAL